MTEYPLNTGERAARDARRSLGIPETGPIGDLLSLAEDRYDVPVLIEPFNADHIAGVLLRQASGASFVAVNADHGPVKQRFTLAHELGHIQMDHQPRVELMTDLFGRARDPQEIEANYFAAEFLAPRPAVRRWVEDRDLLGAIDADVVARLALSFGIAFPTTCYRLERAGLVTSAAKGRLVQALKAPNSSVFARRHRDERLMDVIESLCREKAYPRVPKQTTDYASRALADELIDRDEYERIVSEETGLDLASWFE